MRKSDFELIGPIKHPLSIPFLAILLALLSTASALSDIRPRVDLNGAWDFYADVEDAPVAEVTKGPGRIQVPGAWQAQGYGEAGGTIPSANIGPGTSPAEYLRHNLMARCLYVRLAAVPAEWEGRRVFLCVRRAYRYTDASVNGKRVGEYEGFSSPFEFDITEAVAFGKTNKLVLGVDNRPRPGRDTLGTGNLYGNWGGIGGAVFLEARPSVWLNDVFAMPRIGDSLAVLRIQINKTSAVPSLSIQAQIVPWNESAQSAAPAGTVEAPLLNSGLGDFTVDLAVPIAHPRLWTPLDPFLYVAKVQLLASAKVLDELQVRFGMREITASGRKLFLNGKPLYLSGYGDDATEPITGMLPADKAVYRQRLGLMRSLGFNFVRHHSCVPHDEYFEAADEVGMLVQPEAGLAYTGFWRTGHRLFEQEWPHIVRAFRNHPSIWAWCMGNELFLNELPAQSASRGVNLSQPIANGPFRTVADEENGVFGPPGEFPTSSFKQSNYYRDVQARVDGQAQTILGDAKSGRVFTDGPHELGLKFIASREVEITQFRYFRVAEETGNHTGRLWDAEGKELGRAEFTNETASGWQSAALLEPRRIQANRKYIVSVNANTAYGATAGGSEGISRQQVLDILERAYRQARELDPTRLVHASDGGTPHPFTDILSNGPSDKATKPFLLHEYGTYCCSLPDFPLIPRLTGVIRPLTYERAEGYVREHRLAEVYPGLRRSSLIMRADAQKHYIESAKASGFNSGYSFWLGVDFPDSPEGCWDEGMLNQLWEPKPYLTNNLPDLNGPTVLLTTAGLEARSFYADKPKEVGIRLWQYGPEPIHRGLLIWRVKEGDRTLQQGEEPGIECGLGEIKSIAHLVIEAPGADAPRFIRLEVELWQGDRRITRNSWEFFAYPRQTMRETIAGVYTEAGPVVGSTELKRTDPLPADIRVLITRALNRERHGELLRRGNTAVLLLGTGGFKEARAGYFLNQYGTGFGGIIEDHPMFAQIPHDGRLHLGLYQLVAGGGLLETESMPAALRDGAVVWGLRLTGWISPVKNLRKVVHVCDVLADNRLHLLLCNLDLLSDRPESRYVLNQTVQYLLSDQPSALAKPCSIQDLEPLLLSK